nr:hypothetical protein BaRGS_023106 [Batillaria attramentaria]
MKEKVESAMKAVGEGDRHLDEMVKWMDAKKEEVFDFASRLDAMQTEIQIKFAEIRAHGLRATQTVPNMVDDLTFFNDSELICAADKEGKAVHFYMKDEDKGFTPLLPYFGAPVSPGDQARDFVPVSLSAHPDGFLAILDSASKAVHVLNVEQESACTCRALGEIYQDWCNRTRGKGTSPEDYFSTLLEHLATVKSSFDMLSITHPASSTKRRNSSSVDPGEESGQVQQRQDRYWDQIVQTKLEVENYTSHLTSMQEEILEKFDEIKVHGLSATLDFV